MKAAAGGSKEKMDAFLGRIPIRRLREGDEVGGPVVFLCSDDDASSITGETLECVGGMDTRCSTSVFEN